MSVIFIVSSSPANSSYDPMTEERKLEIKVKKSGQQDMPEWSVSGWMDGSPTLAVDALSSSCSFSTKTQLVKPRDSEIASYQAPICPDSS